MTPSHTSEDVWPVSTPLTTKLYGCKQELEKKTSFISRAALIVYPANAKRKKKKKKKKKDEEEEEEEEEEKMKKKKTSSPLRLISRWLVRLYGQSER